MASNRERCHLPADDEAAGPVDPPTPRGHVVYARRVDSGPFASAASALGSRPRAAPRRSEVQRGRWGSPRGTVARTDKHVWPRFMRHSPRCLADHSWRTRRAPHLRLQPDSWSRCQTFSCLSLCHSFDEGRAFPSLSVALRRASALLVSAAHLLASLPGVNIFWFFADSVLPRHRLAPCQRAWEYIPFVTETATPATLGRLGRCTRFDRNS
jgi:hypothetical protein